MKKKKLLLFCVFIGIIVLLGVGLFALNYVSGAMDYRKTLAVNSEKSGSIIDTGADKGKVSDVDLDKASKAVKELQKVEQDENAAAELSGAAGDTTDDRNFVFADGNAENYDPSVVTSLNERVLLDAEAALQKQAVPSLVPHKGNIVNILLLGLDRDLPRDKTMGVYRTDTMSVASINLDTKKIRVLSIPRDTYVYIPDRGKIDKINTAYVWGGMGSKGLKSTIDVVNTFIRYSTIDYYFCIDMEPVPDIVDALGGVQVNVDEELAGKNIGLQGGSQLLDGKQSLVYIRYRYTKNGDIDRIKHQQQFSMSLLSKMKEKDRLLTDIKLVLSYSQYIKTNLSLQKMLAFGTLAKDVEAGDITFNTIPGKSAKLNKIWYWIADMDKTDKLLKDVFGVN